VGELTQLCSEGVLAVVGSPRLALEGAVLLPQLAGLLGAGFLCYFTDEEEGDRSVTAVSLLTGENAASLADVRESDCIAIVNCDPLEEGPMLALAVRQAWRKGARIYLVGVHSRAETVQVVSVEGTEVPTLGEVPLGEFKKPVVVCGTRHNDPASIEAAAKSGAKFACLFSSPNSFGAAQLTRKHFATSFTEAVATGKVKGVLAIEADIPAELLEGVPFVAAIDWLPTDLVKRADIVLPAASWVEMDGTYINNEGRAQRFAKVMSAGYPIKGLPARYHAAADKPAPLHPPRVHRKEPPGGDPRPAWQVIAALIERLCGERIGQPLTGKWEGLRALDPDGEGARLL